MVKVTNLMYLLQRMFNIGVKTETGFHPVGWVGTGFSDDELYELPADQFFTKKC